MLSFQQQGPHTGKSLQPSWDVCFADQAYRWFQISVDLRTNVKLSDTS